MTVPAPARLLPDGRATGTEEDRATGTEGGRGRDSPSPCEPLASAASLASDAALTSGGAQASAGALTPDATGLPGKEYRA